MANTLKGLKESIDKLQDQMSQLVQRNYDLRQQVTEGGGGTDQQGIDDAQAAVDRLADQMTTVLEGQDFNPVQQPQPQQQPQQATARSAPVQQSVHQQAAKLAGQQQPRR